MAEFKTRVKASLSFRCSLQNAEVAYMMKLYKAKGWAKIKVDSGCEKQSSLKTLEAHPCNKKPRYSYVPHGTMQRHMAEQSCSMNGQHVQLVSILAAAHCGAVANCTVPPSPHKHASPKAWNWAHCISLAAIA